MTISALRFVTGFAAALLLLTTCGGLSGSPTRPTPSVTLTGIVSDAGSGQPLSGATVTVQSQTAATGSDGRYSFSALSAGPVSVVARRTGYLDFLQTATLTSGANSINIQMTPQ